MAKGRSIIEKFTDTVKDIANSASEALKAEEPPKVEQTNAAYMPLAAEGLVSDPLLVPAVAMQPVPLQPLRRRRTAQKTAKKSPARKGIAKRAAKNARRAAKTSARSKARAASRRPAKTSVKRTTKTTGKGRAKRPARTRGRN